jgi:hypothetical protein
LVRPDGRLEAFAEASVSDRKQTEGESKALISDGRTAENVAFDMRATPASKPPTGTEAPADESLPTVWERQVPADHSDTDKGQANGEPKAFISKVQTAEILGFEKRIREFQRRWCDGSPLTMWEKEKNSRRTSVSLVLLESFAGYGQARRLSYGGRERE